jgi:hypothetical protein
MKSIGVLIFAPNQFSNFNFSQTFVEKENASLEYFSIFGSTVRILG